MNAKQLERLLLLEQSGELAPKQRRALDAELAASAQARQWRDQLRGLAAAIAAPAAPPAADAAARIAARLTQAPKPVTAFQPMWKPVLAAAAAVALLLGVRTFRSNPNPVANDSAVAAATAQEEDWVDPLEAEFTELESLLAAISSDDKWGVTEL